MAPHRNALHIPLHQTAPWLIEGDSCLLMEGWFGAKTPEKYSDGVQTPQVVQYPDQRLAHFWERLMVKGVPMGAAFGEFRHACPR